MINTNISLYYIINMVLNLSGPQQPRPSSTQNVYQGYETTQSPIAYGSPGQQSASSSVMNRIQKPANTSPTPVQQAWAIGRQVSTCILRTLVSLTKILTYS